MRRTAAEIIRHLEMRIARLENMRVAAVNKETVGEVSHFIQSDNRIATKPVIVQLSRLMKSSRWTKQLAVNAFMNVVDQGIALYRSEYGLPAVDKETKKAIAESLVDDYLEVIQNMADL